MLRWQRSTSLPVSVDTNSCVAGFHRCRTMATVSVPFAYVAPFERKYQEYSAFGKLGYHGWDPGMITPPSSAAGPTAIGPIGPGPTGGTGGIGTGWGTGVTGPGKGGNIGRCV